MSLRINKENHMNILFNVHYTRPDTKQPSMGIVRTFYKDLHNTKEEIAVHKRHNLTVDDCITPDAFEINPTQVKEASFDEVFRFVEKAYNKACKAAPKTFGIGSMFSLPVGDGKACYMVTAINKTRNKCTVEWRGYGGGDRYTDHHFGSGGTFDLQDVKKYVIRDQAWDKIVKANKR